MAGRWAAARPAVLALAMASVGTSVTSRGVRTSSVNAESNSTMCETAHSPVPQQQQPATNMAEEERTSSSSSQSHAFVPITRQYLRNLYAKYPDPVLDKRLTTISEHVDQTRDALITFDQSRLERLLPPPPPRMDQGMYAARCACEQAAQAISDAKLVDIECAHAACATMNQVSLLFAQFQKAQQDYVSGVVNEFLPKDMRSRLFAAARQRSEARNKAAVDELMNRGGTIEEKYKLLWEQQWSRRETLAAVGNATGIWKMIVRYLAGVPEPLLDFAKQINAPNGPTEELRAKFGPALMELIIFATHLHALAAALQIGDASEKARSDALDVFSDAARTYHEEVRKFLELLTTVVSNSPFFVSPEQIASIKDAQPEAT